MLDDTVSLMTSQLWTYAFRHRCRPFVFPGGYVRDRELLRPQ